MLWILSQYGGINRRDESKAWQRVKLHWRHQRTKAKANKPWTKNKQLEASLEFAHTSIKERREKMTVQDEAMDELKKGVESLTKQSAHEKEKAIKLESHSRRNNLNFFNIAEKKD